MLKDVADSQQVESEVTCREKSMPLISFEKLEDPLRFEGCEPAPGQLALVLGKKARHYEVKLFSRLHRSTSGRVVREYFSLLLEEEGTWKSLRASVVRWPEHATQGSASGGATSNKSSIESLKTGGLSAKSRSKK